MNVQTLENFVTLCKEIGLKGKDLHGFLGYERVAFRERQPEKNSKQKRK